MCLSIYNGDGRGVVDITSIPFFLTFIAVARELLYISTNPSFSTVTPAAEELFSIINLLPFLTVTLVALVS
jgi:hypothetical protein